MRKTLSETFRNVCKRTTEHRNRHNTVDNNCTLPNTRMS